MKVIILLFSLFFAAVTVLPVYSQNDGSLGSALLEEKLANDAVIRGALKKDKKKQTKIVIGKTLMAGMPLNAAFKLLGPPKSMTTNRGSEKEIDSICITYLKHGLKIHALSNKTTVAALEVLPSFKGEFSKGIKIGSKVSKVIETFGMPASKESNIILSEDIIICAFGKLFNSKASPPY